ncbi:MAG TPA: GNAT family N-acetyltransferase [Actinomycetota bacterium]|jgi:predicted GNAT family N-acyltransferase|nr:GNAT family N-acetyltransferase [Actinomycetota bacterium]
MTDEHLATRIEVFPEAKVPLALRTQMVALQDQAWPADVPSGPEPWHDPALAPTSMLLVQSDGRVLAALDILSKDIDHAGERWSVSGLSAVVTDASVRNAGHGGRLVSAARARIGSSGADLGLFTCDAPLRSFYERAGWEHLAGTFLIGGTPEDPYPSDTLAKVTLGGFFTDRAVDAREAFVGARIALYPGVIDRLW